MPTHILFDFFGTLVDYTDERGVDEYPGTLATLEKLGLPMSAGQFFERWSKTWNVLHEQCKLDHREFSMMDVGRGFSAGALDEGQVAELVGVYLHEWNGGVYHLDGMADWIRELARDYRLAIVSNTHEADLVPTHLERMGIADCFDLVVLSVEVGWRKPHPEIYATALKGLDLTPDRAVFVGDTHLADFLGPEQAGIRAYLIDPERRKGAPEDRRLDRIFDLSERLSRLPE